MKKNLMISLKLTIVFLIICAGIYPLLITGMGRMTKGSGDGEVIRVNGKVVGYANIGQKFTRDDYFWGRPSAVDYNAAGSGGSNKGPSNPEYLKQVRGRIDSFLVHHPGIKKEQVPSEMVTASGSGLDPDISPQGAWIQVGRVARARHLNEEKVKALVDQHIEKNFLGPSTVNVLKLNVALDQIK